MNAMRNLGRAVDFRKKHLIKKQFLFAALTVTFLISLSFQSPLYAEIARDSYVDAALGTFQKDFLAFDERNIDENSEKALPDMQDNLELIKPNGFVIGLGAFFNTGPEQHEMVPNPNNPNAAALTIVPGSLDLPMGGNPPHAGSSSSNNHFMSNQPKSSRGV